MLINGKECECAKCVAGCHASDGRICIDMPIQCSDLNCAPIQRHDRKSVCFVEVKHENNPA